ncbi:MAG: hypothetical protein MJ176_05350 [Treponema sp.]|nr:hypothetical protein [Treponema sp.]
MMKKIMVMALAVMSMLIIGCAPAVGGDDATPSSDGIYYEDKNGETITISENGKTISNIKNASLVIDLSVTSLVLENTILNKVEVVSGADVELSFSNTQIEEFEVNGDVTIKEKDSSSGNRSVRTARAANSDKQAEKAKVVIDKLVMKGNVQAGVGLYKKIEREDSDSEFVFEKDCAEKVKVDSFDNNGTVLGLTAVTSGFKGVNIELTDKPDASSFADEKFTMDVRIKKGDMENQVFWGTNYPDSYQTDDHIIPKKIVLADNFYWPYLEKNEEYEITIMYLEATTGTDGKLLASNTIKVTPEDGKSDVIFLDKYKGNLTLKENGDIEWTKTPDIEEKECAKISYELNSRNSAGIPVWNSARVIKADCSDKYTGFNIYKDGFYPEKSGMHEGGKYLYNKVCLLVNYNLYSYDSYNGEEYYYGVHTPLIKDYTNEITYDESKYETAFDVELDKEKKCINITIQPSDKAKALWKMTGGTKLWFTVAQGETKVGESEMIDIDALPETPIPLKEANLPSGALELQVRAFDSNNIWKAWIISKTVE